MVSQSFLFYAGKRSWLRGREETRAASQYRYVRAPVALLLLQEKRLSFFWAKTTPFIEQAAVAGGDCADEKEAPPAVAPSSCLFRLPAEIIRMIVIYVSDRFSSQNLQNCSSRRRSSWPCP